MAEGFAAVAPFLSVSRACLARCGGQCPHVRQVTEVGPTLDNWRVGGH